MHDLHPTTLYYGVRYEGAEEMKLCYYCAHKATKSPKDGKPPQRQHEPITECV